MFDHEKNVGTQSTTTAEQNPASAVSSIVTAQVELCAVMSQCMLTWATLPIEMMLST